MMCKWGTDKLIHIDHVGMSEGGQDIYVDACIADYVQRMNDDGVVTVSCCCGHSKEQGTVLIERGSAFAAYLAGYNCREWYEMWPRERSREDVVVHVIGDVAPLLKNWAASTTGSSK